MKSIGQLLRDYYFCLRYPETCVGKYRPIKDARTNPHVKEVAEFAVSEYNKSAKTCLKCEEVISAEEVTAEWSDFRLVISASASDGDGGSSNGGFSGSRIYEAVVYEKVWENYRELTSFKPM